MLILIEKAYRIAKKTIKNILVLSVLTAPALLVGKCCKLEITIIFIQPVLDAVNAEILLGMAKRCIFKVSLFHKYFKTNILVFLTSIFFFI